MFGRISEAYTVRRFWGRYWHQLIRHSFQSCSAVTIKVCRIPRGTVLSSQTQIWIAFLLSGLGHAQGLLMLPWPTRTSLLSKTHGTMMFFLWQALMISCEDALHILYQKHGMGLGPLSQRLRALGYLWVLLSFWISIPWVADNLLRAGLLTASRDGFSPLLEIQSSLQNLLARLRQERSM